MKGKSLKILHVLLLLVIVIIIVAAIYLKIQFSLVHFEEAIFSIKDGTKNTDSGIFIYSIIVCLPFILILFSLLCYLFYGKRSFKVIKKHKKICTILLFVFSILLLLWSTKFYDYVYNSFSSSGFIEVNYVDPKETEITFNKKRNLIFIVVESLETSMFTKTEGGYWDYPVIPELYKLLEEEDTVVFYNKDRSQTVNMIQGSSWTTASVIANSSGLPFKVNFDNIVNKGVMSGSYTLGDLLKDNGYYNEVISAANTTFGDLGNYFDEHGDYEIIDYDSLKNYNLKMSDSDIGKWGFNDKYLFESAKKRLDIISKKNQPFNLELITIDTHFIDGFVGDYSETKYEEQYENAYATESRLIYDFISWVKTQPYYENTTIVVTGDHLSMQSPFFRKRDVKDRYVYNCIINPVKKTSNNKDRVVTPLDMYPTIVSSIGGNIKGDRLGLGVNLFSNEETLAEKYGFDKLNNELKKESVFYDSLKSNK